MNVREAKCKHGVQSKLFLLQTCFWPRQSYKITIEEILKIEKFCLFLGDLKNSSCIAWIRERWFHEKFSFAAKSKIKIFFHGFRSNHFEVNGEKIKPGKKDFAFLSKLTAFDPLPENDHPYYQIKDLTFLEIENSSGKIIIDLLPNPTT